MDIKKTVEIFTDGACSGNPGPGGYGAILRYNGHEKEISGGDAHTTNNRMEISGVIAALKALKEPCIVKLTTDSQYVSNSINKGWIYGWEKNNWIRKSGKKTEEVPNADLWQELLKLIRTHDVTFIWVRGHNGHPENERCDQLAVMERDKFSRK